MQDKAIAHIGHWQLNQKKGLEKGGLAVEDMFIYFGIITNSIVLQ
ncbi:MAG: hypothetical protein U9R19_18305 [Bacteroidota bacterium]|nr:hypothetical protein [Bacteroidota bacterium]